MTWPVEHSAGRIRLHVADRGITEKDASRQERTVKEILARLAGQPGIVLADEVGMGKTFVALAVADFAARADRGKNPVIVMVPPSVKDKWPGDYAVFAEKCIVFGDPLRSARAETGVDLLKLLDDPPRTRAQLIFVTHGALHRSLSDRWTRFAALKFAMHGRHLGKRREALPRFAAAILQLKGQSRDPDLYADLLRKPVSAWRDVLRKYDLDPGDDPVPEKVVAVLERRTVDLGPLDAALDKLPERASANLNDRIREVRQALSIAMRDVWPEVLRQARFRSPLLILDEAHHLKNPATRLASLFAEDDAREDARMLTGALDGRFERMLFLTATPFQLGHGELLEVLERFRAIVWKPAPAGMTSDEFDEARARLRAALDEAQVATTQLDLQWRRIEPGDLVAPDGTARDIEAWWADLRRGRDDLSDRLRGIISAYERARLAMRAAEKELRPWIVRHMRDRILPGCAEARRRRLAGRSIHDDSDVATGIEVGDAALLPFLLAARAQAMVSHASRTSHSGRATFAEGLASSYQAFLETSKAGEVVDEEEWVEAPAEGAREAAFRRYLDRLKESLPSSREYADHPKIAATVARAIALWRAGEKVLIFCHFRATGRALEDHLSAALLDALKADASARLGVERGEVLDHLRLAGEAFDPGSQLLATLRDAVMPIVGEHADLDPRGQTILDVVRRFVTRPVFLGRYLGVTDAGGRVAAFERALAAHDGSGISLLDKIRRFVSFLAARVDDERTRYLDALGSIESGMRHEHVPTVRRCTGDVDHDTRRRLLLGFNTPFFPEILIASSVLAEGVDLHLACRHVIHHDLSWNPSTLEQRTGRIDRMGAKAETARRSIHVYLPYVAQTQDEKMYRVVCDRERWFQAVMGEDYRSDEWATDNLAARVPLPESAARDLAFRLSVEER